MIGDGIGVSQFVSLGVVLFFFFSACFFFFFFFPFPLVVCVVVFLSLGCEVAALVMRSCVVAV